MKLWTLHTPGYDLTKGRIDHDQSEYYCTVICHSASGVFVVRKERWKLQFSAGSGGWSNPKDSTAIKQGLHKWQLYDLSTDPKETKNLIKNHPEVVKKLTAILRGYIEKGRSTPGAPQKNHDGAIWWKGLPWSMD